MEGNTALGASSPAKPAFTRPEPLSHTRAVVSSSSHMVSDFCKGQEGRGDTRRVSTGGPAGPRALPSWGPTDTPSPDPRSTGKGAAEGTRPEPRSPGSGLRCDGERGTGSSRPQGEFLHPGNPSTGSAETSLPSLQAPRGRSQALAPTLSAPRWPHLGGEDRRYLLAGHAYGCKDLPVGGALVLHTRRSGPFPTLLTFQAQNRGTFSPDGQPRELWPLLLFGSVLRWEVIALGTTKAKLLIYLAHTKRQVAEPKGAGDKFGDVSKN